MSTHTDAFRQVLFTAGEGLEIEDAHNIQRFALATVYDQILRAAVYGGHLRDAQLASSTAREGSLHTNAAANWSDQHALSLTGGGPFFEPTANAREVQSASGILLQHIATHDGSDPKLLAFEVPDGVTFTLAVGDATNPRIDLIEAKLEYVNGGSTSRDFKDATTGLLSTQSVDKTRRVRCTLQVKQGTPASAATVRYPTPTAGFCAVAAVYVPATHNAVFTRAQMRTLSIPLGAKEYFVPAHLFHRGQNANNWDEDTASPSRRSVNASAGATEMLVFPPVVGPNARVLGVNIYGSIVQATKVVDLVRVAWPTSTGTAPTITSICNLATDVATANVRRWHATMGTLGRRTTTLDNGVLPDVDLTGKVMDPIWCNGQKAGPAMRDIEQSLYENTHFDKLALRINDTTGGSEIWGVSWIIAAGL